MAYRLALVILSLWQAVAICGTQRGLYLFVQCATIFIFNLNTTSRNLK